MCAQAICTLYCISWLSTARTELLVLASKEEKAFETGSFANELIANTNVSTFSPFKGCKFRRCEQRPGFHLTA